MSGCKKSKISLKFCSAESNPFLDDQLFHPISNLDEMGLVCCPFQCVFLVASGKSANDSQEVLVLLLKQKLENFFNCITVYLVVVETAWPQQNEIKMPIIILFNQLCLIKSFCLGSLAATVLYKYVLYCTKDAIFFTVFANSSQVPIKLKQEYRFHS